MAIEPELARIIEVANDRPSELIEDERRRAMGWQVSYLHMHEGMFRRYEKGFLSPEVWGLTNEVLQGCSRRSSCLSGGHT